MRNPFKGMFSKAALQDSVVNEKEAAWSESTLYRGADFPKYNPDGLQSRKGYAIYSKMMTDEQVKAVVRFKRDAITSRDWEFKLDTEALSEDEKKLRIRVFTEAMCQMKKPLSDALNGIMSAMYYGFSMTEKLFAHITVDGKTWVGLDCLKLRPCDTFYFHVDWFGNITKIEQRMESQTQDLEAGRFIHFVQNPDYDEHYGRSELREAYRAWFSKDMVIKFQNIHLERFAAGFVWASPTNGKTIAQNSAEFTQLKAVMQNLQATSSIILPANIDLNIEHPATTDAFEKAISQHDSSIAKALLVPNLLGISEQGRHGSYGQSQTQLEAFLWTLDADATRLEASLNANLFKELGDYNFGDGIYPSFKFKPISDARKLQIVGIWKDLVAAGAVQSTSSDEEFLRDSLEMPRKPAIDNEAPDLVLNGEQVTALLSIITQVGAGQLTPEAAKAIITAVFPVTEKQAAAMVDNAKPKATEPAPQMGPDGKPLPPQVGADGKPVVAPALGPDGKPVATDPAAGVAAQNNEQTVVGHSQATVSAFSRALKRVDFAVIANKADYNTADTVREVAQLNSVVVARLVAMAADMKLGTAEGNPLDVKKITYTAGEVSKIKAACVKGLKNAWNIGTSHGQTELAKAKGSKFAVNDMALQDIAAEYLAAKGYTLAGDISGATQKKIQGILMEGIKVSKTQEEIKKEIYQALEADGLVSEEAVADALGASTVKDASSRIATAIRTTSFEAINEARYQLFTDPDLDGFVDALEYSAILDDRTTEICSQLNGETYAVDDDIWSTFRPPNHFNCRSILIPVTINDTWTEGEPPTVQPQKGFGFTKLGRPAHSHAHDDTGDKITALEKNQTALMEALIARQPQNFTFVVDSKQGKTTKTIKMDEATGNYTMTEESSDEQE